MDIQNELNGTAEQPLTTAPAQQQTSDPICPRCGKVNLPDGGFCRFCGSSLSAPQPAPAPAPASPFSQGAMGSAYQPNTMQGIAYQQNPMGNAYQPQFQGYNYNQPPMGMGGFYNPNPIMLDPRFQQFTTSALQQGQREIVRCMSVSKAYGNVNALGPIDLVIGTGRVIGLLGPNGSGKTTLIKLLCGLLTPTSGNIKINGWDIGAQTKAMVSYLPDRTYIPEWMKIKEILDYFSDFYADFRRPLAETMLGNLRIDPNAVMKTLSKGTQEKVQLVLVMSRNASLYLLDEPIAGVDPVARDYILDTIIGAHNPESSVVISTHLITDIEPALNEVIMIKYGSLALHGDADTLRNTFGKSLNDIFKEVFAGC